MNVFFWMLVVVFRISNSCVRESFYHFDELAHSLEIGHYFAFGYGDVTSEWSEKDPDFKVMGYQAGEHWYGIRASFHPFIYAGIYCLLKILRLDLNHYVFVYGPRVFNGLLCFLLDYSIYHYSLLRFEHKKVGRNERAETCLAFSMFCSCNFFLGVRFFSNSLEAVLTSVALWMWAEFEKCVRNVKENSQPLFWCLIGFVWLSVFACFLRMSNCLFWVCHAFLYFVHNGVEWQLNLNFVLLRLRTLFSFGIWNYVFVIFSAFVVTVIQVGFDYGAYGKVIFPMYNNFMFNIVEKKSDYWGVLPNDYYFFRAIPFFLQGYLFFFVVGVVSDIESFRELFVAGFVVVFFSKVGHKENRFIFPAMPFLLCICERGHHLFWRTPKILKRIVFVFCCVLNLTTGWIYLHENADMGQARGMWDAYDLIADNKSVVIILNFENPVGTNGFIHFPENNWKIGTKTKVLKYLRCRKNFYPEYIFIHKNRIHILMEQESRLKGVYEKNKTYRKGYFDLNHDDYVQLSKKKKKVEVSKSSYRYYLKRTIKKGRQSRKSNHIA